MQGLHTIEFCSKVMTSMKNSANTTNIGELHVYISYLLSVTAHLTKYEILGPKFAAQGLRISMLSV